MRLQAILSILYIHVKNSGGGRGSVRAELVVIFLLLALATAEAQKGREGAQKAFERGYQYQTGQGVRRDLRRAVDAYREAIMLDPTYADAYYNLAQVCFDMRRYDLAEWGYTRYLKFQPNDPQAVHDLGVVYHKEGKLDDAIRQYRRALELNPDMAQAHYNLGNIYYGRKREALALQEWDKAIQLDPNNETYINQRERITRLARQKESVLSPDTVWWIMYGLAGTFVIYYIVHTVRKRR